MAIYHLHAKTGSRKNGQSAAAKSDYIQRQGKYALGRDEVLASGTGHMPAWAADPRAYWQAADLHERANGRLYKEIEFALPVELTLEQQRALVDEFAEHITGAESLPYSYAIHAGRGTNPHCHLMVSERVNDGHDRTPELWFKRVATGKNKSAEDGGARKSASLKPRDWLEQTREAWADHANRALDRAGIAARVDHRSLTNQGIERVPQIHVGTMGAQMIREGTPEQSDRAMLNLEIQAVNLELHQLQERAARRAAEREAQELAEWEAWTDQPGVCSATGRIDVESRIAHDLERSYRESQRLEAAERAASRLPTKPRPVTPVEASKPEPQPTPYPAPLSARERALADVQALFDVPTQLERAGIIRDAMIDSDEQYADAFEDALVELKIGHLGELPAASRQESEPQRDAWSQERQQEPPQRNAWAVERQGQEDRDHGPELG